MSFLLHSTSVQTLKISNCRGRSSLESQINARFLPIFIIHISHFFQVYSPEKKKLQFPSQTFHVQKDLLPRYIQAQTDIYASIDTLCKKCVSTVVFGEFSISSVSLSQHGFSIYLWFFSQSLDCSGEETHVFQFLIPILLLTQTTRAMYYMISQ